MSYTVTQLVTEAFYLSGIVSRNFSTVDGSDFTFGVQVLNDLLAEKLIDDKALPYYTSYSLNFVAGQETYFVENLIDADTVTFVIDTVRYPVWRENRTDYFGQARANNINSLPYSWHIERTLNGSNMYFYFKPEDTWVAEIWGKFGLAATTGNLQDLELVYDRYYITYLRYQLADRLCAEYEFTVPNGVQRVLYKLEKQISKKSAVLDLNLNIDPVMGVETSLNYGQINLGKAWTARR
jgi:hypothetical protein